jgi:F0F1-type ATP synthase assembly protein I
MAYAQDMLDKLKSNKEKGGNKMILEQTEGTFVGSAIGLFLGLYIGHSRNYSLIVSGLVGMLVGGFVTKQMIKIKEK